MAGEAVASPMRLATVPGRSARPAPPGNDDPCGERRTIAEGLPRLPREAITKWSQTGGSDARSGEQRRTASTGPGQKSHVERRKGERAHRWVRKTPRRKPGWLVRIAHIERGHGLPVVRNERKAGSCSGRSFDEASARRSWRADRGASQASKRHRRSARPSRRGSERNEMERKKGGSEVSRAERDP